MLGGVGVQGLRMRTALAQVSSSCYHLMGFDGKLPAFGKRIAKFKEFLGRNSTTVIYADTQKALIFH
jgi:hypothetical protein